MLLVKVRDLPKRDEHIFTRVFDGKLKCSQIDLNSIQKACEDAIAPIGNMSEAPVLNAMKKGMAFQSAICPHELLALVKELSALRTLIDNATIASGEPVGEIRWIKHLENVQSEFHYFGWKDGKQLPVGTELFTTAQPIAPGSECTETLVEAELDNKNTSKYKTTTDEKNDVIELFTNFIKALPDDTVGAADVLNQAELILNIPKGLAYKSNRERIGLFRSTLKAMIHTYDDHEIRSVAKEAVHRDDKFEEYELKLISKS